MKSATGRWVSGDNFFDRADELDQLEELVSEGNHVLLTGQRRMGKTSVARELGARLQRSGWGLVFADIEGARDEEDAISTIASAALDLASIRPKLLVRARRWLGERAGTVEELKAHSFGVKFRAMLAEDTWRPRGRELVALCAGHSEGVLMVLDELPIFLARLLKKDRGTERADEFLSWLREAFQFDHDHGGSPVLLVSGSIGLVPLVERLRIPDRINYLHSVRLGPWPREVAVECLQHLSTEYRLSLDARAANEVYDRLGIGIPQHVQSFFARLRFCAGARAHARIGVKDVKEVYRNEMLGPAGQSELAHYETRLREALGDARSHEIACTILAETATQGVFTAAARQALGSHCYAEGAEAGDQISWILGILDHDGYLERSNDGYRFLSRWLQDWWLLRSRDHHVRLEDRPMPPQRPRIGY